MPSNSSSYEDYAGLAFTLEEIANSKPEVASILVDQVMVQEIFAKYGNDNAKYNSNETYALLCSEANLMELNTMNAKAVKSGDDWQLEGKKQISSEQFNADKFIIFAKDEDNKVRLFEINNSDITINNIEQEIAGSSVTLVQAEFNLTVSNTANVAIINDDFERIQSISRTLIAAVSLGIGHDCIVKSVSSAKQAKDTSGLAITNSQSLQFELADLFSELEAGRSLTYLSANMIDDNKANIKYATMAKIQSTDAAAQLSLKSLQILGNLGYISNSNFAEMMKSAVNAQVKGGTNRVQHSQLYKYLLAKK